MKKILIISVVLLSFLGFTSCNQEEIKTYDNTDNIYFSAAIFPLVKNGPLIDSTGVSFAFDNTAIQKKVYLIPLRVQGKLSDVDRTVKCTIDQSSTANEGTHFSLPKNIIIRARKEVDTIAVTMYRTPDLKLKNVTLVLNLEENEFFTTKMQTKVINTLTQKTMNLTRFKLTFGDLLSQPQGWPVGFLGVFTAKKLFLMCDLLQLEPSMFDQKIGALGLSTAEVRYYGSFMKRYLADQKASGNTIYEDNGTEMTFP
ncbi:DUF4843 domain-containing protein [Flavobacterium phragmitis]|uniref:DUF4843 domain-containing protein n=1 Tax=Flavobacterium phragmitis TaxID=739143 RepID=A0A1I1NEE8_9FLAO|nr:DUF4843 domain-containing protein [Flavobacterium phragmitis]SFC96084.1 protein of unknown function [Flavobacterium phragmitis]